MSDTVTPAVGRGLWTRAAAAAARTPASRNRYVDFLRAGSILAVITGHWLVAAPYLQNGELSLSNMLARQPWTQWLTLAFQVMPVFFFVGGYANGVSWKAARLDGRSYGAWLQGRMQRLVGPVLPLLLIWIGLGIVGRRLGVDPALVTSGSQMALVPVWFLAVYVMVVVAVPLTYAAWQRWGLRSFFGLVGLAVVDDVLFFAAELHALGWLNYGFVWLAVHQLGYAWREGWLGGVKRTLPWAVAGAAGLGLLVTVGPYPVSMVSVPGDPVSNTLPPKLPMLLLGVLQAGVLLVFESPMRRWLERAIPWTAAVLVNGMIMTIYLWHLTAMTLLVGLLLALGGLGLTLEPGTGVWWATRPLWMAVLIVVLAGFAGVFGRFERGSPRRMVTAAWRLVPGAALVCAGLSLLALRGIGADGWLGIRLGIALLPFVGAALAGVSPLGRVSGAA